MNKKVYLRNQQIISKQGRVHFYVYFFNYLTIVGMGVLTILTIALLVLNRQRIVKVEKAAKKVKI